MRTPRFFRPKDYSEEAHCLYIHIVQQARQPEFFVAGGVPDTIDGRFELIILHLFLVLDRLGNKGGTAQAVGQKLFDVMFADFDQSLREMGVGDMGIGKRIKKMGQAFYGRIEAYENGVRGEAGALEDALGRNLFGTAAANQAQISKLARYMREQVSVLEGQPLDSLLQGNVEFGRPEFS